MMLAKNFFSTPPSSRVLIFLFVFFTLMLWVPAIFIPFWGDDYYFLVQARDARLNHSSWLTPFFSDSATGFWRPLSMDTPWRIIESFLMGNSIYAHVFSFTLWLISIVSIVCVTRRIANTSNWESSNQIALLAGLIYSISAINFLVLHWVSAINSSLLVIFSCLTLYSWMAQINAENPYKKVFFVLTPLFYLCALFCKESAIVLPILIFCLTILTNKLHSFDRTNVFILLGCVLIGCVWFYFFKQFIHNRHASYDIAFGVNILENLVAAIIWAFNVPRDSIRMLVNGNVSAGILWVLSTAIPALIFFMLALKSTLNQFSRLQWVSIFLFIGFAYGPYLVLSNQSYEYYLAIAFIMPAILLAKYLYNTKYFYIVLGAYFISSFISTQGSRNTDYPGLIGRAHWAEKELTHLETLNIPRPLYVKIQNSHQFYAIGLKGIAWRLDIPESQIYEVSSCDQNIPVLLEQNVSGEFVLHSCNNH